jgi:hypothetical protein
MAAILKKVQDLALLHDKVDPRVVREKMAAVSSDLRCVISPVMH